MTEDQIRHMVNRFLGWKLPESFNPDGGVTFKKDVQRSHADADEKRTVRDKPFRRRSGDRDGAAHDRRTSRLITTR